MCVCACIYAWVCVKSVSLCMPVHACGYTHVCLCTCDSSYMCSCMYAKVYTSMHCLCTSVRLCVHVCAPVCVCVCAHVLQTGCISVDGDRGLVVLSAEWTDPRKSMNGCG